MSRQRIAAGALCIALALVLAACGGSPPVAEFTAEPTSGEAPLSVVFTDASSEDPESWAWDFGDGSTSTEQSPTHVYEEPGSYRVILTVTNGEGSDDVVKADLVTVTAPPLSDFCQSVQDLGDAVDRLIDPDTVTGGLESVTAALDEIRAAFDEVRSTATEEYQDEVQRVENAIDAVQSAIDEISSDATPQEIIASLAAAGLEVTAAVNALREAVQQGCEPSS
jgi:PKD repeat protein